MTIFRNAAELEKKFNYPKIKGEKFSINPEKIPEELLFLVPFIDYYVSGDELTREDFYVKAPLEAWKFLQQTMVNVDNMLDDFFSNFKEVELSAEYLGFSILREMSEEYSCYRDDGEEKELDMQRIEDFFKEVDKW